MLIPRQNMKATILITALVSMSALDAFAQVRTPSETVKAFYGFSTSRSSIFDRQHVELRKRWYTDELYQIFINELKEQEAQLRAHPTDKPFFGDGLSFGPLDEPCHARGRSFLYSRRVGLAVVKGASAFVDVTFSYPKVCTEEPIVLRVKLQKILGRWLIADWIYPEGSSLVNDMKVSTP